MRALTPIAMAFCAALLTACGGGGSNGPATGQASLDVTDAPADNLQQVHLTITGVGLKPANGPEEHITLKTPLVIDNLLDLNGEISENVMPTTTFPAGKYNWLRLYIAGGDTDSYVVDDAGGQYSLYVPGQQGSMAGKERFVQLVSGFVIPVGGQVDFTLDVDVKRAITKPVGKNYYLIRPAFRIVDNSQVGTIHGVVDESALNTTCTDNITAGNLDELRVYLYPDNTSTPGDVYVNDNGEPVDYTNSSEVHPLTVADVVQEQDGSYSYTIGFVPQDSYTVALTCEATSDDPATDDDLSFAASKDGIAVTAGETAPADLP
ncbi:MAG: DUF4382 domain-containing protein [Alcanivorax sp.]|nr:DUF4382 domain-containing protein [Alcanivorax sp.]